ncbi:tyrosine-type recombinase/integrase, partial [Candidatus Cardinium hertigii]
LSVRRTHIDLVDGTIHILGKCHRSRIIPFPKPLKPIIRSYLSKKRRLGHDATEALLITGRGKPCYPKLIYRIVKKYLLSNVQSSRHSPHVLRHSFATHLLNRGATLLSIRSLLGHANLATTQNYNQVHFTRLKEVLNKAHTRA